MNGFDFSELGESLGLVIGIVAAVVVIFVGIIFFAVLRKPKQRGTSHSQNLKLDVAGLEERGPDWNFGYLECYGIPVRLNVLVVAAQGRGVPLPNREQLYTLLDRITPGLGQVAQDNETTIIEWPAQLSADGFAQSFSYNLALPGDAGRGTKWCSLVGSMSVGVGQLLIGLLCCAEEENQLSHFLVKNDGQWRDLLRVKD